VILALSLLVDPARGGAAADRALIGQLDREVIALRLKVSRLQEQLATCADSAAPDPLYAELVQVMNGQEAAVSWLGRRTMVSIPLDELYAPDSLSLREEAWPILDLVAMAVKLHPEVAVTVVAHGDDSTPPAAARKILPTPWEWTAYRAASVARELAEGFGVSPHRITWAGRGAQDPISSNDTPEGRALNRRIVIVLEAFPTEPKGNAP